MPSLSNYLKTRLLQAQHIYIRTVSSQHLQTALPNYFKLVYGSFGQSIMHFVPAQIIQEETKCTKAKQELRAYCPKCPNICTVSSGLEIVYEKKNNGKIEFNSSFEASISRITTSDTLLKPPKNSFEKRSKLKSILLSSKSYVTPTTMKTTFMELGNN
jgi:hypothetical protein